MKKIELLAPAKDLECGIEAVNQGADAVYIGSPRFSARFHAGNSLQDIEALCRYAHLYHARVFVAFNTILTDRELEEALPLIHQLYHIGADALIVQDMGLLMLDLPPIALHASTQTDNRSLEKVLFLEKAGFQRVVLARELELPQIADIAAHTRMELEAFVYGSVCVSYSGQCYMSQYYAERSANRGRCAQCCRLPYSLLDGKRNVLIRDKHLLSLQDMDRTAALRDMIDAGISSFKIEGRLKDVEYVKNSTAWFRQQLDAVMEGKEESRASSGRSLFAFQPCLAKSFHRGGSDYFLRGRRKEGYWFDTPKSIGEEVGRVVSVRSDHFTVESDHSFSNGDGFCFFDANGHLEGFQANRVEAERIFPNRPLPALCAGRVLYRNHDHAFSLLLNQAETRRVLALDLILEENEEGFQLTFSDEDGNSVSFAAPMAKVEARKGEEALEECRRLFAKLGNTVFYLKEFSPYFSKPWFIPASQVSRWKRHGVELLMAERIRRFEEEKSKREERTAPSPATRFFDQQSLDYLSNVMNGQAKAFYHFHGAREVAPALERKIPERPRLMRCKYCLKYAINACPKEKNSVQITEPLFLRHQQHTFALHFDCDVCEMSLFPADSTQKAGKENPKDKS